MIPWKSRNRNFSGREGTEVGYLAMRRRGRLK
jgi:hypothetical protein